MGNPDSAKLRELVPESPQQTFFFLHSSRNHSILPAQTAAYWAQEGDEISGMGKVIWGRVFFWLLNVHGWLFDEGMQGKIAMIDLILGLKKMNLFVYVFILSLASGHNIEKHQEQAKKRKQALFCIFSFFLFTAQLL